MKSSFQKQDSADSEQEIPSGGWSKPKKLVKRDKKKEKQENSSMDLDEPKPSESDFHHEFSGNYLEDPISELALQKKPKHKIKDVFDPSHGGPLILMDEVKKESKINFTETIVENQIQEKYQPNLNKFPSQKIGSQILYHKVLQRESFQNINNWPQTNLFQGQINQRCKVQEMDKIEHLLKINKNISSIPIQKIDEPQKLGKTIQSSLEQNKKNNLIVSQMDADFSRQISDDSQKTSASICNIRNEMRATLYSENESFLDKTLRTIKGNIINDYEGKYTGSQVNNVVLFYKQVYAQRERHAHGQMGLQRPTYKVEPMSCSSQQAQQDKKLTKKRSFYSIYKQKLQQQNKLGQNEINILEWFEKIRGYKFDQNLPGAQTPSINQYPHTLTCSFSRNLKRSGQDLLYAYTKYVYKKIKIGPKIFELKQQNLRHAHEPKKQYLNKKQQTILCLYSSKKRSYQKDGDMLKTSWYAQKTNDDRFIWRAYDRCDIYDVFYLMQFLLAKRYETFQCPSIAINCGSHGQQDGLNAYSKGQKDLLDQRIVEDMHIIIHCLLNPHEKNLYFGYPPPNFQHVLTQYNVREKIHISDVSLEKPNVYPLNANHIIDTHCYGACSMLEARYLMPKGRQYQEKSLKFLECKCETLDYFWHSAIVMKKQQEEKLLRIFETSNLKIKQAHLLFRASFFEFSIQKFFKMCGKQANTMIICKTKFNKIIGAYTPLPHEFNQKCKHQAPFGQCNDESKQSFLFSLSQNDKFQLQKDSKFAILHTSNQIIFGACEFVIADNANTKDDCKISPIHYYQNQNYQPGYFNQLNFDAYRRLNGGSESRFIAKEWEVWKINASSKY